MAKEGKTNIGRKQFDGKDEKAVVQKLEYAFALGCSDAEAYVYAGISKSAFYTYQQQHPEFLDRKEGLKTKPILRARATVVEALGDPKVAMWYLGKKSPTEFGDKIQNRPTEEPKINLSLEAQKRLAKFL